MSQINPSTLLASILMPPFLLSAAVRLIPTHLPRRYQRPQLSVSMTTSSTLYGLLPIPTRWHEQTIALVSLLIVGLLFYPGTRRVGAVIGAMQVGNGAWAKWRHGMGIGVQVVLVSTCVGVWWAAGKEKGAM